LTGSGRKKTDYVLSNLFDPSATIDPAYRLTNVLTSDGRLLSGFIVYQDDRFIEVRTQEARIRLSMKDVDELVTSRQSMMPEGMLRQYTDQQVRDLLRYLASPEQVPLPAGSSE
jgi:putative heme-binding domain-containing protein